MEPTSQIKKASFTEYICKVANEMYAQEPPQTDQPMTYAGAGFKAGLAAGVPLSIKYRPTTVGAAKAGLAGAVLWGAIGGLGGGLKKRKQSGYDSY